MNPNQNPYDFLHDAPAPKRSFAATTKKGRILQAIGGVAILLITFIILLNVLSSAGAGTKKQLLELTAAQADVAELTAIGVSKSRSGDIQTKSQLIELTVATQRGGTVAIAKTYGIDQKKSAKEIATYRKTSYVNQLKEAELNNNFDTVYQKILADRLGIYRAKLKNAYAAVEPVSQKTQFSNYYAQLEALAPTK